MGNPKKNKEKKPSILIAFGGNAINVKERSNIYQKEEFPTARKSMESVVDLYQAGYERIIITHGNGPQVGRIALQQELTVDEFPRQVTFDVCVADSQGRIGYILQNVFDNICVERSINKKSSTVITQVVVDENDPSFQRPTKPIGVFYSEEDAKKLTAERQWVMKEDSGRGWRRVVPSPEPLEIIEKRMFEQLLSMKFIGIGCGGGGIPVIYNKDRELRGVEAVIDKDRSSALLAKTVGIEILVILTEADYAYLHYNSDKQEQLETVTVAQMEKYIQEGHFAEGSMGPKVEAATQFVKEGGKKAIIANLYKLADAVEGTTGTQIIP